MASRKRRQLHFEIGRQPNDTTCGPTCLHAVYGYFGDELPLEQVVGEVRSLEEGGTLAVLLGCHALERGYQAQLYSYNLQVFDPTWFPLDRRSLMERLRKQLQYKTGDKLRTASEAYLEFLERGGQLRFMDLSPRQIRRLLARRLPVLTGLCSTYLYRTARERLEDSEHDDLRGEPMGHFVVLCGWESKSGRVLIADPLHPNPMGDSQVYSVDFHRLITSILLGVLTYDANLLQIEPPPNVRRRRPDAGKEGA